jgi:membrane protein
VLTSLAAFLFGSKDLADQAVGLLLQTWPPQVAGALSDQIHDVLTTTRGDVLTVGAVLSVYFASNGVEALRVGLNRAYAVVEPRRWYWLRLESIGYTLVAAFTALAMGFLIVLGPLMIEAARRHIPLIVESNEQLLNILRYGIAITALIAALFILHAWLPAGRRRFLHILPGIAFTVAASLVSAIGFGQYLARFANNYVTMYAGLASVIIALVFLYFIAAIFVYGGELNAAIIKSQLPHERSLRAAQSRAPAETQA